jgi:hypothetical protein
MRAACPTHLILLDLIVLIILRVMFSNTLSLRSSLNVRDQVSRPYRTFNGIQSPSSVTCQVPPEDYHTGLNRRLCSEMPQSMLWHRHS